MSKQDITEYSDEELSMLVFNTESLYDLRSNWVALLAACKERYKFTDMQSDVLWRDVELDKEEDD